MSKLFLLILLVSCATQSREWGAWKVVSVPSIEKVWHFCRAELDGPSLDEKGVCYQDQECRYKKKTLFSRRKEECRPKVIFCEWGAVPCLKKYNVFFNKIINKGITR